MASPYRTLMLFIEPNYSIPVRDLFYSVVRADFFSTKKLNALCLGRVISDRRLGSDSKVSGGVRPGDSENDTVPSWIPNFSGSEILANPHVYRYRHDKYRASGDTCAPSVLVLEFAEESVKR